MNSNTVLKIFCQVFLCLIITSVACQKRNATYELLSTIDSYRDLTVSPCDNFYKHACGNWTNIYKHELKYFGETLGMIDYKVNKLLMKVLKMHKHSSPFTKQKFIQQVRKYYRSCKSLSLQSHEKYLSWLQAHEQILNSKHSHNKFDWVNLLATLGKYGMNGVFWEVTVIPNRNDTNRWVLDLDKPVINGGYKPFAKKELYLLLTSIKEPLQQNKSKKTLRKLIKFEKRLNTIYEIVDETPYEQLRLRELNMPWIVNYLKRLLGNPQLNNNTQIYVQNLTYLQQLWKLLKRYDHNFIILYIKIRFLYYISEAGPRDFSGVYCVENARKHFPLAMHWLYEAQMDELQLAQTKTDVRRIFENMRNKFTQIIQQNRNNFNDEIQQYLLMKVQNMRLKIGNIPRGNTKETIEQYYGDLQLNSHDYYDNLLKLLKFNTKKRLGLLNANINTHNDDFFYMEDSESGYSSSPYYLTTANMIILPLSLLTMPLYHIDLKDAFKYSSIGFLLAHELTHAYDESGLASAELIQDNEEFEENLECLRADEPKIIDEKIADVTGFRLAYETYFDMEHASHSTQNLFFSNFVMFFCGDSHQIIPDDVHGADEERVTYTLSNFNEFSNVYNCAKGSPMNPEQKCQLWR